MMDENLATNGGLASPVGRKTKRNFNGTKERESQEEIPDYTKTCKTVCAQQENSTSESARGTGCNFFFFFRKEKT